MGMSLQEILTLQVTSDELRDFENKLFVPKPCTDYLKHSLGHSGVVLWNSLLRFVQHSF